jgi:hypothetical protein
VDVDLSCGIPTELIRGAMNESATDTSTAIHIVNERMMFAAVRALGVAKLAPRERVCLRATRAI